jgi:hypothetical protein
MMIDIPCGKQATEDERNHPELGAALYPRPRAVWQIGHSQRDVSLYRQLLYLQMK